ncbi:MAG: hypothetical protein KDD38_03325 [Bdellovibrionales bacterium]|nr:hypothetical protein [Bdellovibrionales bacterium]
MFKKIVQLILVLNISLPSLVYAAPMGDLAQATGLTNEEKAELTGTRKQLATIIFAGLSGAILGLSTLSFYGRPQDHLSNIAIGFAFGVIGGVTFTTYKAATKPYEVYQVGQQINDESYNRFLAQSSVQYQPRLGWSWEF